MPSKKRYRLAILLLTVVLLIALPLCALCGAAHIGWQELWQSEIFWQLRLPRIVMALLVGAVLAASGTGYQAVFRNPLTDPYLLGISSGASLGATLAIIAGLDHTVYGIELSALVVALLTVVIVTSVGGHGSRYDNTTLLLTGVCLTLLISAVVSLLTVMSHDKMERIIFWTMGSLAAAGWDDVVAMGVAAAIGLTLMLLNARELNMMLAGTDEARSMGVDVTKVRRQVLVATTLMVAVAVASCGVIGFVGLVVPHGIRRIVGPDNRRLLPATALAGALLLLVCDTATRTLFQPAELPIGSLTALIGAPLFIALIRRNYKNT